MYFERNWCCESFVDPYYGCFDINCALNFGWDFKLGIVVNTIILRLFSVTLSVLNFSFYFFAHGVAVIFMYKSMFSFVCFMISVDFARGFKFWLSS